MAEKVTKNIYSQMGQATPKKYVLLNFLYQPIVKGYRTNLSICDEIYFYRIVLPFMAQFKKLSILSESFDAAQMLSRHEKRSSIFEGTSTR